MRKQSFIMGSIILALGGVLAKGLGAFYMIDGDYLSAIDCYKQIPVTSKNYDFALNNFHAHLAGIEYTKKGEKKHLILEESDMTKLVELIVTDSLTSKSCFDLLYVCR